MTERGRPTRKQEGGGKPPSEETMREVDRSYERDAERWIESYTQQTGPMLARRAAAARNGH